MIVLSQTTDRLQIILGNVVTTNQLRCISSWRDRTSTTFTADKTVILTNNTTSVNLVSGPSASTQRLIDFVSVYNSDTVTATVTIIFNDNGTDYVMLKVLLLPDERIEYTEGRGWRYYASNGSLKADQSASGSANEIQYNINGVLGSNSNFTYNQSTNTLSLIGVDGGILLQSITSEPPIPAAGMLEVYCKSIAGKLMLKQVGPSGLDSPLQNAIWQNNTVLFTPAAAAGVWQGTIGSNLGTPTVVLPTMVNVGTMLRRSNFPTVVTTLNQQVGTRTESMFFRGSIANLGGFFFVSKFMLGTWTTGNRLFVGMCAGTTAVVTVEPSTLTNILGFGVNAADTEITFMHNDAAGSATKDTISGQPALATNNAYAAYIFCRPNDSTVYYRLDNLSNGTTIIDTSTTTDLPVNTTALTAQSIIGNAANTVAGSATIGINRIYIETDI